VPRCLALPSNVRAACDHGGRNGAVLPAKLVRHESPPCIHPPAIYGITPRHSLILFIGGPVNISFMMIGNEDSAFFGSTRDALPFLQSAVHQQRCDRTAAPHIGARIEWVNQNIAYQALGGGPSKSALSHGSDSQAPRCRDPEITGRFDVCSIVRETS
jgi:hypothetical protein